MTSHSDISGVVRDVYRDALKRDPEEWSEFLDRACAGRPDVRQRVEILLNIRDAVETVAIGTPPPAAVLPEGTAIGDFVVRRRLGEGGMGVVYLADDTKLSRPVAIKLLSPALGADPSGRQRLLAEAKVVANLSHPSIATLHTLLEIGDGIYLVYEYVPGEPLRAVLKSGPVPIQQAVDIALQLSRALETAHTQGVVHRDVKPENIMRTPSGVIKVLDFGLAKSQVTPSTPGLTLPGTIVGTPAYLSPEQAQGLTADFRTDIFAIGVLAYELVSGRNPFAGPNIQAILARILTEEPRPLSELEPRTPPMLDQILARCLRKNPLERYQTTRELVADLERLQHDLQEATAAHMRSDSSPAWRSDRVPPTRPRWWWETHQLCVCVVYVAMLYPAWYVQRFLPSQWGMLLLLALLGTVAAAASLRLHLLFVAHYFPSEVAVQHGATRARLRVCDFAFGVLLLATALVIGPEHPEFSMLFVGVAAATMVAAFVIEPATARVAFGDGSGTR